MHLPSASLVPWTDDGPDARLPMILRGRVDLTRTGGSRSTSGADDRGDRGHASGDARPLQDELVLNAALLAEA